MASTDAQPRETEQEEEMAPISGKKRLRSSSPSASPELQSKRRVLSVEQSPCPSPRIVEPLDKKTPTSRSSRAAEPDEPWCCPKCGRHCLICRLSSPAPIERVKRREEEAPIERAKRREEDELERRRMPSDSPSSTAGTSSVASSSKKRKQDQLALYGMINIGPRDKDFKDRILDPLGVIRAKRPQPKNKPSGSLGSQPLPQSRVINKSDGNDLERITTDFKEYQTRLYDEHSLTTLCYDSIILRDSWVENALADSEDMIVAEDQELIITSVRRDRWKPHKHGPSIPGGIFTYDWDLEPDSFYAVSIRIFDLEYRKKLHTETFQQWVAEKDVAVCPYLTVEYKSAGKGGKQSQATNQAIAAAILWLHQRKDLRNAIRKPLDGLNHYLITIVDSLYIISKARVQAEEYIISEQVTGDLTLIDDLKLYMEWSNAIHAWGLGQNASAFKQDIEDLVKIEDAQPSNLPTPAGTSSPMGPPVQ